MVIPHPFPHESSGGYQALMEARTIMVLRTRVDGKCDYCNAAWLAFTGRTLEQELGDGWQQGIHPDDLERCLKTYRDALAAKQPFEMEYRLRRYDGHYRYVSDRGGPYIDELGRLVGFIGGCFDVDELRAMQRRS